MTHDPTRRKFHYGITYKGYIIIIKYLLLHGEISQCSKTRTTSLQVIVKPVIMIRTNNVSRTIKYISDVSQDLPSRVKACLKIPSEFFLESTDPSTNFLRIGEVTNLSKLIGLEVSNELNELVY